MNPKEIDYSTLKDVEDAFKKDIEKSMGELFSIVDKKHYQNHQDKKTIEFIGLVMTYMESVNYSQNKLLEDHRFAWDSYLKSEELSNRQAQSFKKWYQDNHQSKK